MVALGPLMAEKSLRDDGERGLGPAADDQRNGLLAEIFGDAISVERRLAIFTLPNRQARHFADLEGVNSYCVHASDQGQNVYFGLGLIRGTPQGRGTAEDVTAIGALWCDIDLAGSAHPGKALPASIEEVEGLLRELPLAPSVVVDSGHGAHAYWFLKEPWVFEDEADRQKAAALARGWHGLVCRLAETKGWKLENLSDLARVLRVPGTVNHKVPDHPVPVRILRYDASLRYNPSDFEEFVSLQDAAPSEVPADGACDLVLRPGAEPPVRRMVEAAAVSPKFVETWNRQRPDLLDQSQSAYDLSLATIAAVLGWTDQEIADLIIAARREHNEKPEKALRQDYMLRTLATARRAAAAMVRDSQGVDLSGIVGQSILGNVPGAMADTVAAEPMLKVNVLSDLIDSFTGLSPPVIRGLLREGETMNVIASSKIGKSWLVSALGVSVASGLDWLGFGVEQGRVLHIDNELHASTSTDRYQRISEAMGIPHHLFSRNIDMVNLRGQLRDLESLGRHFASIEPGRYKLVIIDAFYRALPRDTDENDNGAIAGLYNLIDRYAAQLDCAFVLVHHTSKGNQSAKAVTDVGAGAGSQSRAADTHLVLRLHEEDGVVVLDAATRSWSPIQPVCLQWEFPLWHPAPDFDPTALRPERPRRRSRTSAKAEAETPPKPRWTVEKFVADFVTNDGRQGDTILNMAIQQGLSKAAAKRMLSQAQDEGRINRWASGANRPVRYATEPQPLIEHSSGEKRRSRKS